jgi:hypothetical protein
MNGPMSADTRSPRAPLPLRMLAIVYGGVCYLTVLATFLYAIGFVGNLVVAKSIDSGPQVPLAEALAVHAASPLAAPCPGGGGRRG